jgi:hypothetical protein
MQIPGFESFILGQDQSGQSEYVLHVGFSRFVQYVSCKYSPMLFDRSVGYAIIASQTFRLDLTLLIALISARGRQPHKFSGAYNRASIRGICTRLKISLLN